MSAKQLIGLPPAAIIALLECSRRDAAKKAERQKEANCETQDHSRRVCMRSFRCERVLKPEPIDDGFEDCMDFPILYHEYH